MAGRREPPGVGAESSPAPATWDVAGIRMFGPRRAGTGARWGVELGPLRVVRPRPPTVGPRRWATVAACGRVTWARGSKEAMRRWKTLVVFKRPERARRLSGSPLPALTIVYTEASLLQEQLWKLGHPWDEEKEIFHNWFISKLYKYLTVLHFTTAIFFPRGD